MYNILYLYTSTLDYEFEYENDKFTKLLCLLIKQQKKKALLSVNFQLHHFIYGTYGLHWIPSFTKKKLFGLCSAVLLEIKYHCLTRIRLDCVKVFLSCSLLTDIVT